MISEARECYLCGSTVNLQKHHCLHGSMRKKADEYDLTVYLCMECHQDLHDHGIGDRALQAIAQRHFEELYGHKKYMKVFGKNFRGDSCG